MAAGSVKVVSDTPPADTVGSSSMTITEALALYAALWASILKRNGFRLTQVRDKTKTARTEELQEHQRNLLFLFLVGAEHGEVEVRLPSGAARRRSRFPCPLGRGGSGGPGRSRSSYRSSVRRSHGNSTCRGRVSHGSAAVGSFVAPLCPRPYGDALLV